MRGGTDLRYCRPAPYVRVALFTVQVHLPSRCDDAAKLAITPCIAPCMRSSCENCLQLVMKRAGLSMLQFIDMRIAMFMCLWCLVSVPSNVTCKAQLVRIHITCSSCKHKCRAVYKVQ